MVSQLGITHSPIKPILIIGVPGSGTTLLYFIKASVLIETLHTSLTICSVQEYASTAD